MHALTTSSRGTDDEGYFLDPSLSVGLSHRRLAIIDPEHAQQPMTTEDGRFTIVFNGAIYNYLELRVELIKQNCPIRTFSDTEVLLYAYALWGKACLDRLIGMFAFAIWDRHQYTLFCARDRLGIKPFYYVFTPSVFIFASEIKAILAEGSMKASPNFEGIQDYLTFQFCLEKKTLFQHIVKLEPAQSMLINIDPQGLHLKQQINTYWHLSDYFNQPLEDPNEQDCIQTLAVLLKDSVRLHLRADVPLGAHLSGGLDSSFIVAQTRQLLKNTPLKTFTGAFREGEEFDETRYAKQVASATGALYHELYITADHLQTILPKIIYWMDEPLAGPGVIPQYYISKFAANEVKVVLGGQGGDEIFIGYARYLIASLEQALGNAIYSNHDPHSPTLASLTPQLPLLQTYRPLMQQFWRSGLFEPSENRYFRLINRSEDLTSLITPDVLSNNKKLNDYQSFEVFSQIFNHTKNALINKISYFDLKTSLPALLHVEDRTSMAASLESRLPLLDHRLVEWMARIPSSIKFPGGQMKYLFKQAIRPLIPPAVFNRKDKMGFTMPLTQWIHGPARSFIEDILFSKAALSRGLYQIPNIRKALQHEKNFGRVIWGLLCLELWHQIYIDHSS